MRAPLVAAAALLAVAIPASLPSWAQDVIAARKSNFTAIRDDFRWINQQQNSGDLGAIAQRSSAILERAQRISGYFPTGSETGGNTNALATVWSEKATFDQRAADLVTRVREMEAAARSGDRAALQGSVRNTGAACQACHDRFRRPLS